MLADGRAGPAGFMTAERLLEVAGLSKRFPLPRPLLTNPNPLHHPRVLPARNGQCRIHARPERTRPLTGAGIEAVRRPRERRPRRFLVHATAPRSKVAIAGHNMHVKSSWESVLQLAVLPQLVNLFQ